MRSTEQVDIRENEREHVVEIVRDAARELSDGFELLNFAKLAL